MRRSVRRWLLSAGAVATVGASVIGQGGMAVASPAIPAASTAHSASTAHAASSAARSWVSPSKYLVLGDHGAAVKKIQLRLKQLKYYPGPANGTVGLDTLEAIWAFKAVQHMGVDNANQNEISRATERRMEHPVLPRVLDRRGAAQRIEVNQFTEVLVLYRRGRIELISHVSTGGGYHYCEPPPNSGDCGTAITPNGHYYAHWFAPGWITVPLGTMYNPVFFIGGAYAIHGDIPVPWYAASHGCVRIPMDIAPWFHKLIHVSQTDGTPIIIEGKPHYYL
jgi:hypothetical protein